METKTVLITGTSTGFGRDAAETMAREGHTVFATMRDINGKNQGHASALREQSAQNNWKLHVIELDVTSQTSIDQAMTEIQRLSPRIDVLVNNAGYAISGISEAFTLEQLQAQFDTNVFGVHRMLRAVLPGMRARKDGLVITIGSVVGRVTMPFVGLYGATKFALEALIESYRYEVSPFAIEMALIQPSAYPTEIYGKFVNPADTTRLATYGDVAEMPAKMVDTIGQMMSGESAPKPHEVVEAISRLIQQPKGQRAIRTVVGNSFGADAINEHTAPIQQQAIEALGLGQLGKIQEPALQR